MEAIKKKAGRPEKFAVKDALEMKLKGVATATIARSLGVSKVAIHKRLKPLLAKIPGAEYRVEYQENQADILDALSAGILNSINAKDLRRASLLSKVNSTVALIDRSRLIRGQSTQNSVSVLLARHVHINHPAPSSRDIIELNDEVE